MITFLVLSVLGKRWRRIACRLAEVRQLRRETRELARMSAYELSDLGISHAELALSAPRPSRCG